MIKILNFTNSQQSLMSVDLMSNSLPFNSANKLMPIFEWKNLHLVESTIRFVNVYDSTGEKFIH